MLNLDFSRTSKAWVDLFARYNSGTYNNQWTVVDYKMFKPGQPIPDKDMLWILEQTPGFTETMDVTYYLKRFTYFPSYNIPMISTISQISGFSKKVEFLLCTSNRLYRKTSSL